MNNGAELLTPSPTKTAAVASTNATIRKSPFKKRKTSICNPTTTNATLKSPPPTNRGAIVTVEKKKSATGPPSSFKPMTNPYAKKRITKTASSSNSSIRPVIVQDFEICMLALNMRCVVCKRSECDGEKCLNGACFKCGERGHGFGKCVAFRESKKALDGLTCFHCLDKSADNHEAMSCPKNRRLRRLIMKGGLLKLGKSKELNSIYQDMHEWKVYIGKLYKKFN